MLVPFFANHDLPRFASAEGSSPTKLKLAFGLTLTLRGIPEIYYGDEIGMPGGGDPDNRRDFPGGFPGDARDAFTTGGRRPEEAAIFDNVRRLAWLRSELAPLRRGRMVTLAVGEQTWAYARVLGDQAVVVVM